MGAKLFYSCKNGFHCFRVCYRISVPYSWITLDVCVDLVSSNRDKLISIVSLIPSTMLNPLQGSSKPDSMELLSKFCKVLFKPYQHISTMLWTRHGLTLSASHWKPESGHRIKVLNVLKTFHAFRKFKFLLI